MYGGDARRHKLDLTAEVGGVAELVYRTQQHADYARAYHRLPSYKKHWRHSRWTAPAKVHGSLMTCADRIP